MRSDLRVADEIPQQPAKGHCRADSHLGARCELGVNLRPRRRQRPSSDHALGDEATQGAAPLQHVLDFRRVGAGVVVRRIVELVVGDRQLQPVAEHAQFGLGELLGLVGDVASLDAGAESPALDRLGQDHRRSGPVLRGGAICGVDLAVVMAAPPQPGQLIVREVLDEAPQPLVGTEEVLADVGPAGNGELLELAVQGLVHLVDEQTVHVAGQQIVPLATPDHLDNVPPRAAEEPLELLDDLAVAADRAV